MAERALIIDDSLPLHKLIKAHLEGEGLDLHSAYDGMSGINKAEELRPGLILLDVDMPELDGFEVCRRLKASTSTTAIPIIFLTSDFDTNDKVKGLDLGAADYVTKPFKPEELRARVRACLRARNQLNQRAMIDGLTGLWNRTYLDDHLAAQLSLANRTGAPVSCILADVDHLAEINRKHGEVFGDEILRSVGNVLLSQCRAEDAICRYGGGKFAILASMNRTGAGRLADRLCSQIQRQLISRNGREIGVTCSFGVADSLVAGDAGLLERSEFALVRAKQNGRCCVSIARPPRKDSAAAAAA